MESLFSQALGICEPWFVKSIDFDEGEKRLDISLDFRRGSMFSEDPDDGNSKQYKAYDTVKKSWRHLNFFEHECHLHARIPRIKPDGGGILTIMPPWSGKLHGFTLLFEAFILQLCKNMPVHQVAKIMGTSDHKIWHMIDLYVDSALFSADHSDVSAIGIDETSVARGHDYISLFVDLKKRKTIHISDGKGASTVKDFIDVFEEHSAKKEQIKDVSCDMSPAFISGVKENLPNAQITFDKFHVVKIINQAIDEVRREEAKTNPILKNSRYVLLKNDANLTTKQRIKKQELLDMKEINLKSMQALQMRENFQQIYHADSVESFVALFKSWYKWIEESGLKPMQKAAKTIRKHWYGIVAWKESQINNGILEGLNSVIQAAKRKARGYGKKHFKTIAYLMTGKLNFTKINQHLPTRF